MNLIGNYDPSKPRTIQDTLLGYQYAEQIGVRYDKVIGAMDRAHNQWKADEPARVEAERNAQLAQQQAENDRVQQQIAATQEANRRSENQANAQAAINESNEGLFSQKPQIEEGGGAASTAGIDGSSKTTREKRSRNRLSSNLGI